MTRDELIDRLASHIAALATRFEKLYEELLATRRALSDLHGTIDTHGWETRSGLQKIGERLALIDKGVDTVREETGAHRLPDPTALRMWDRFAAAPPRVQMLVVALVTAVALGGWVLRAIEWWIK